MHLALYSWPRATLERDQESQAVAQRPSLGCHLPVPAMPTPERSALPPRKKKWAKVADSANGHQPLYVLFGE